MRVFLLLVVVGIGGCDYCAGYCAAHGEFYSECGDWLSAERGGWAPYCDGEPCADADAVISTCLPACDEMCAAGGCDGSTDAIRREIRAGDCAAAAGSLAWW